MYRLLHDLDWVLALRSPAATAIFSGFSWTGYTPFIMLFLPLGYWAWNKSVFTRLALFVFISALLNALLKDFFQDPRPDSIYHLDSHVPRSYGMPSGHAQTAVVLWFWLAHEMRRRWIWYLAIVMVLGTCFSRLYLGVHDLEDVLTGVAVGGLCIGCFRWTQSAVWNRWREINWIFRIGIVLLFEFFIFVIWPRGLFPWALQTAGVLFGWFAGAACERIYVGYQPSKSAWRVISACLIGIASIYLLFILRKTLAGNASSLIMSFISAAFTGLYITLILPVVFRLSRLAGDRAQRFPPPNRGAIR
ncbi:MAG: phosphatase PAP2 family protein [Deltaproteobacteria bacterium]|nr:phosphatase PAP2 family protein [Deltaproteobacteria bacterium]